jgi:hypothetical protein
MTTPQFTELLLNAQKGGTSCIDPKELDPALLGLVALVVVAAVAAAVYVCWIGLMLWKALHRMTES